MAAERAHPLPPAGVSRRSGDGQLISEDCEGTLDYNKSAQDFA